MEIPNTRKNTPSVHINQRGQINARTEKEEEKKNKLDEDVETITSEKNDLSDNEEYIEIEIDEKNYCTNNEDNGYIYNLNQDGEIGVKVGYLKDGEPFFYEDEK